MFFILFLYINIFFLVSSLFAGEQCVILKQHFRPESSYFTEENSSNIHEILELIDVHDSEIELILHDCLIEGEFSTKYQLMLQFKDLKPDIESDLNLIKTHCLELIVKFIKNCVFTNTKVFSTNPLFLEGDLLFDQYLKQLEQKPARDLKIYKKFLDLYQRRIGTKICVLIYKFFRKGVILEDGKIDLFKEVFFDACCERMPDKNLRFLSIFDAAWYFLKYKNLYQTFFDNLTLNIQKTKVLNDDGSFFAHFYGSEVEAFVAIATLFYYFRANMDSSNYQKYFSVKMGDIREAFVEAFVTNWYEAFKFFTEISKDSVDIKNEFDFSDSKKIFCRFSELFSTYFEKSRFGINVAWKLFGESLCLKYNTRYISLKPDVDIDQLVENIEEQFDNKLHKSKINNLSILVRPKESKVVRQSDIKEQFIDLYGKSKELLEIFAFCDSYPEHEVIFTGTDTKGLSKSARFKHERDKLSTIRTINSVLGNFFSVAAAKLFEFDKLKQVDEDFVFKITHFNDIITRVILHDETEALLFSYADFISNFVNKININILNSCFINSLNLKNAQKIKKFNKFFVESFGETYNKVIFRILSTLDLCWYFLRNKDVKNSLFKKINFDFNESDENGAGNDDFKFFSSLQSCFFIARTLVDSRIYSTKDSFDLTNIFLCEWLNLFQYINYKIGFKITSYDELKKEFFKMFGPYSCKDMLWQELFGKVLTDHYGFVFEEDLLSEAKQHKPKRKDVKVKRQFKAESSVNNLEKHEFLSWLEDSQLDVIEDHEEKDSGKVCHWFADSNKKLRPQVKEMMKKFQAKFYHKLREEKIDQRCLFLGVEAAYLFLEGRHNLFFSEQIGANPFVYELLAKNLKDCEENSELFYLLVTGFAQIYESNVITFYIDDLGQKTAKIDYENLRNDSFLQGINKFKSIILRLYKEASHKTCKQKFISLISHLFGFNLPINDFVLPNWYLYFADKQFQRIKENQAH